MAYRYPVVLKREQGDNAYTVTFPDFPEGITFGDTVGSALFAAVDCLDEVLASRVHGNEKIPVPSKIRKYAVEPSIFVAAKVALFEAFGAAGMKKGALARLLDLNETEVRRMLDPYHPTKLSRIERALAALGKRISIEVSDLHING